MNSTSMSPFLLRFAERRSVRIPSSARYDSSRQITQTLVAGAWVDCPDVHGEPRKKTSVDPETTE